MSDRRSNRGDRLIIYVTAHGERSDDRKNPYETSIMLWDDEKLSVSDFVALLDRLPEGVSVVAVMVQCYTGGFARFIYDKADPENGLAKQNRCGFFATVHDRVAAGCTPDVDETTYVEYSTYFWEALAGHTRTGQPIVAPRLRPRRPHLVCRGPRLHRAERRYDRPAAHVLQRIPQRRKPVSRTRTIPKLLPKDAPYDTVLELATPAERAVLEGLSKPARAHGQRPHRRRRRAAAAHPAAAAVAGAIARPASAPPACATPLPTTSKNAGPSSRTS